MSALLDSIARRGLNDALLRAAALGVDVTDIASAMRWTLTHGTLTPAKVRSYTEAVRRRTFSFQQYNEVLIEESA